MTSAKRRPNFSPREMEALLEEAKKCRYLHEKHRTADSNDKKKQAWKAIARAVSAVGVASRTPEECRKKLQCLRSVAKTKAADLSRARRMTGGGSPPPPLTSLDTSVLDLVPATSYEGIEGGVDTSLTASSIEVSMADISDASSTEPPEVNQRANRTSGVNSNTGPSSKSAELSQVEEAISLQRENNSLLRELVSVMKDLATDIREVRDS